MRNFVECFWKIKDCGVNCFVRLDSTCYVMNGTYELCFCWSFRSKAMLTISEHSISWKMLHNMAVYNMLKYLWCNAGKWHGPIIWRIRFLSFLVNSAYGKVWTYPRCPTNTKRSRRIKQGALGLILFFGWFRRHSMKTWKSSWYVGPAFSSFNPCP